MNSQQKRQTENKILEQVLQYSKECDSISDLQHYIAGMIKGNVFCAINFEEVQGNESLALLEDLHKIEKEYNIQTENNIL